MLLHEATDKQIDDIQKVVKLQHNMIENLNDQIRLLDHQMRSVSELLALQAKINTRNSH
jgi:hypothetical protein